VPSEPPPCEWQFPPLDVADESGLVGIGADLEPATVLLAYRSGLFPMPVTPGGPIGWWSPDPRAILEFDDLVIHRSLRRSCRRFEIRFDSDFVSVIDACADPSRPDGWIDRQMREAYIELHRQGWAHSVEAWLDDRLVGGLYGLIVGGLFAGESMFHHERDASKVTLVALVDALNDGRPRLLDVQWRTDHLASLGVIEVPRQDYLIRLDEALIQPHPPKFH
jgi:leucyl/phenylalanyl-tRNA--protein transferase